MPADVIQCPPEFAHTNVSVFMAQLSSILHLNALMAEPFDVSTPNFM